MYILKDLWCGRIHPSERRYLPDSEYGKINHEATQHMHAFCAELSKDGKRAFESYCNAEMQLADISEQDSFIRGVRMGVRFILDAIGEYQMPLPQITEESSAS